MRADIARTLEAHFTAQELGELSSSWGYDGISPLALIKFAVDPIEQLSDRFFRNHSGPGTFVLTTVAGTIFGDIPMQGAATALLAAEARIEACRTFAHGTVFTFSCAVSQGSANVGRVGMDVVLQASWV